MKRISWAKFAGSLVAILMASPLWAGSITIVSPDTAQTKAESHMKAGRLYWSEKERALYADVTFSNEMYATIGNPRDEDYYLFKLPGVALDDETKTFYATNSQGQRVPIATWQDGLFGRNIKLARGAQVHVNNKHGDVRVLITASTTPSPLADRKQWIEDNRAALFDRLATR